MNAEKRNLPLSIPCKKFEITPDDSSEKNVAPPPGAKVPIESTDHMSLVWTLPAFSVLPTSPLKSIQGIGCGPVTQCLESTSKVVNALSSTCSWTSRACSSAGRLSKSDIDIPLFPTLSRMAGGGRTLEPQTKSEIGNSESHTQSRTHRLWCSVSWGKFRSASSTVDSEHSRGGLFFQICSLSVCMPLDIFDVRNENIRVHMDRSLSLSKERRERGQKVSAWKPERVAFCNH